MEHINKKEIFITKAKRVHHDKYDYSKVEYVNDRIKVCIICPEHGEFWQTPHNHIRGSKCPKCALEGRKNKRKLGKEEFVRRARLAHGDKYDYSKVEYINTQTKVCIICPEHGEFWQTPEGHTSGQGCPKCAKQFMNKEYFVELANKKHKHKYDYSKVEYINNSTKVCIICPEHGEFWQTPHHHLQGFGCRKCSKTFLDKDSFIEKARKIHGDKYDYSQVEYTNNHTKVCIICPEHGKFWQTPGSHLNGRACPLCKESHLEREINNILEKTGIDYIYQYHNKDIFKQQSLDFFIPQYSIGIECQGEQHYISNFFKSKGEKYAEQHLEYIQELDVRKRQICRDNGITLIYFLEKKFIKYEKSGIMVFTKPEEIIKYLNIE